MSGELPIVRRLLHWADSGDFGRKPDPTDIRRQAADTIKTLFAALEGLLTAVNAADKVGRGDFYHERKDAKNALLKAQGKAEGGR